MAAPVVTLTGIIEDPAKKLAVLMSYYFKGVDYNLGVGDSAVYSFTVDITGETPAQSATSSVRNVLKGHFDDVEAVVTFDEDLNQYTFKVNVIEQGRTFVFNEVHDAVTSELRDYKDVK